MKPVKCTLKIEINDIGHVRITPRGRAIPALLWSDICMAADDYAKCMMGKKNKRFKRFTAKKFVKSLKDSDYSS